MSIAGGEVKPRVPRAIQSANQEAAKREDAPSGDSLKDPLTDPLQLQSAQLLAGEESGNDWIDQAEMRGREAGIIEGNPDGSFDGAGVLNQQAFLTMLYRAIEGQAPAWDQVMAQGKADGATIDDTSPDRQITRGEAAWIICALRGDAPARYSTNFTDTEGHRYGGYLEILGGETGIFEGEGTGDAQGRKVVNPDGPLVRAAGTLLAVRVKGAPPPRVAVGTGSTGDTEARTDSTSSGVRVPRGDGTSDGSADQSQAMSHAEIATLVGVSEDVVDLYYTEVDLLDLKYNEDLRLTYDAVTGVRDTVELAEDLIGAYDNLQAIDTASGPAQELSAVIDLYDSMLTLIPAPPGYSEFFKCYRDILAEIAQRAQGAFDTTYRGEVDFLAASGFTMKMAIEGDFHVGAFPGGYPLAEHMVELMQGSGGVSVSGWDKREVRDWLEGNAEVLGFVTGEPAPVEDGILGSHVDEEAAPDWMYRHRDHLWQLLYPGVVPF